MSVLAAEIETCSLLDPLAITGRVAEVRGLSVLVEELSLPVGALVRIDSEEGQTLGEIVGFTSQSAIVMLLGTTGGIRPGAACIGEQSAQTALVGERLLGRVIDGLGNPIDGKGRIPDRVARPLDPKPIEPLRRRRVSERIDTGVRAIDLMATLGRGQRMGIFAGPGVGKSTLLGMIARNTAADVNVIALIGERGREVRDFIEQCLGEEGLAKSVVVVATGDESPLLRLRAARYACCVAEYFRDTGRDAMLMMDSVTRFAHAQRQVGLSVGEPPATKGYTPSVFASLSLLLERAGAIEPQPGEKGGSVTGLYTILVEGDDLTEPVSDAARGILDGHIVLSRRMAQRGHFPAIDVLDSISRVSEDVSTDQHIAARHTLMRLLAAYNEVEDLVQIGAYARGSNPDSDTAIDMHAELEALLVQARSDVEPFDSACHRLIDITTRASKHIELLRNQKGLGG